MPRPCVRGARGRFGGFGPVPGVVSPPFPPSRPACPALRLAGRPVRVSFTLARWYAIPRGLCVPRAWSGCPSGSPRVPFACVCARAPAASAPPPPWVVWRAHLVRSWHWALVGPFPWGCGGGGRAFPGGVPSTVARGVWGQALPLPRLPVHWAGCWGPLTTCCGRGLVGVGALHCPLGLHALWGLWAVPLPGLGLCAPLRGACRGGVALPRSVPLPSLGRQQSGCHWRRSVHGGRGPPYHSGSCSPAFTGRDLCGVLARWRQFLWELAARAGGRDALRLLSQVGGGGPSPLPRGVGAGPPRLAGRWGGWGGGMSRRGFPAPPLGGGPWFPTPAPLLSLAHSPPACACGRGRGAAPGVGGIRGGPWTAPPGAPADLNPPSALPEWAVVMGGSWEARPPYSSGAPPCAAPRLRPRAAPARWCGLACRPRPPREQAAGGAGARGVQVQPHPPPPHCGPFWGRGASPRLRGGGGSLLWFSSWGAGAARGGGWGGRPPAPPPRRASASRPLSPACPRGVYSCRGGCRAAAGVGRGPVGRQWVSAAAGGGGGMG